MARDLDRPSVRRMREAVAALADNPDGAAASTYRENTGDGASLLEVRALNEQLQRARRVVVTLYFEGDEEPEVTQVGTDSGTQTAIGRNITQIARARDGSHITQVLGDINIGGGW